MIDNHFMDRNTAEVQARVEACIAELARAGATIVHAKLAHGLATICAIELALSGAHHDRWLAAGRSAGYQPDVRTLVEMGRPVSAVDYLKAEQARSVMAADFARLFDRVDVVVTPTEPITAWPRGREHIDIHGRPESVLAASWRLTYPFNRTGLPAISIPCGFDTDGLQIAARPFDEVTLLQCAAQVERSVGPLPHPRLDGAG